MKYIIFTNHNGPEQAVIFPDEINHDVMARHLGGMMRLSDKHSMHNIRPVAAGFVDFSKTPTPLSQARYVCCHGKSETLELFSRGPADDDVIRRVLDRYDQI